jgi:hypothetical protein
MLLDPTVCAVGTSHISTDGKRAYTIVERDVKSDFFYGGLAMIAKYWDGSEWKHQAFCQATGHAGGPAIPDPTYDSTRDNLVPLEPTYDRWIVMTPESGYLTHDEAMKSAESRQAVAVLKVSFQKGEGLPKDEKQAWIIENA